MTLVLAIDPGTTESAWCARASDRVTGFGKVPNAELKRMLATWVSSADDMLAMEMIASYGMPVGAEVFETCVWIGRFLEAWGRPYALVYRREEKIFLCGSMRATDANIRTALIDRFGGKATAIGNKKQPGQLYGMSGDCWAALAVAETYIGSHSRGV